jgi:hypothetical protein
VPVAERRRKALKKMEALRKKGQVISPITIEDRTIVKTFWGKAWCNNLESYSDYENRLPRGLRGLYRFSGRGTALQGRDGTHLPAADWPVSVTLGGQTLL